MKRVTAIALLIAAGCGTNALAPTALPPDVAIDAGPPLSTPPALDAGILDAPPPDISALCGRSPISPDDWEDCYHLRWCAWLVACDTLGVYHSVQQCLDESDAVEGGRLTAERRARLRAVSQGSATLDPLTFARCLADTSPTLCNTAPASVACATRYIGTVTNAGACAADIDCASPGAVCALNCPGACCTGTCQPRGAIGQVCDSADPCQPGLVCHHICLTGDVGMPCTGDRDCDPGAWCREGTCTPDLSPGSECTSGFQCGGVTMCVGLTLSGTPGHCLSTANAGDRCDFLCHGNRYCDTTGHCRDLPILGARCASVAFCGDVDAICQDGQCVARGPAGAPCGPDDPCHPGLFCSAERDPADPAPRCTVPGDPDAACTAPNQCASYLCSGRPGQVGICRTEDSRCFIQGTAPDEVSENE